MMLQVLLDTTYPPARGEIVGRCNYSAVTYLMIILGGVCIRARLIPAI